MAENVLKDLIAKVVAGEDLTMAEAEAAFNRVMSGEATPVQMAALLVGLRTKGHAPSEVAGGVRALRAAMVPVPDSDPESLIDTCGTGGGSVTTFNISTAAALVAAAAGARVAKHGNRSFTSKSGSADVLEALGVTIQLTPDQMAEVLDEVGIVFMFAPLLHPAMRYVGPVRRELGVPTIMNLLGPLTNPAGARRQVVGVADPHLVGLIVEALRELGHVRALVVHGSPGMDELSPTGETRVAELRPGDDGAPATVSESTVSPESLGIEPLPLEGLKGGTPEENAALIRRVLSGEDRGAARSATLMNAAAAIYVAGQAGDLESALSLATAAVDQGVALAKLEALVEATGRFAE